MSVQVSQIHVTWEDNGTQSRFHTLLIRSSLRAAIATVLRHYRSRQSANPLRLF